VGAALIQTDGHDEGNRRFSHYANAPKWEGLYTPSVDGVI